MRRREASPTRPEASATRPVPSPSRPEASASRPGLAVLISSLQELIGGPLGAGLLSEIKIKGRIQPASAPNPNRPAGARGPLRPARGSLPMGRQALG